MGCRQEVEVVELVNLGFTEKVCKRQRGKKKKEAKGEREGDIQKTELDKKTGKKKKETQQPEIEQR